MTRFRILSIIAGVLSLAGCTAGAPSAPIGLDRRPANSAATIASLQPTGDHTPAREVVTRVTPATATTPQVRVAASLQGFVISDFETPGGVGTLPETQRNELITAARSANSVVLLVRGDGEHPSQAAWNKLVLRGVEVKRYLVAQGVDPTKIRIFARSAGGFVADNATREGRARNRRIEIHMQEAIHGQKI